MRSAITRAFPVVVLVSVSAWPLAAASKCDRPCLAKTLDEYLSAIVKHAPALAPLASNFRYTENANDVRPGDGLWKSATALGKIQRRYFDPINEQAVYFGHIEEGSATSIATVRIRVVNKKITEGEVVIGRKSDGMFSADGLTANSPPEKPVAKGARSTREAMIVAAQSYFDGIQNHDSSRVLSAKGCVRIENGVMTAGPVPGPPASEAGPPIKGDCGSNMEDFKATIAAVDHRRYPVVDEEAGVVLGMVVFNRPPGAKRRDGTPFPRNLLTEIFAVENGRIRGIYAAMHYMTPDNPKAPGWE